MVGVHSLHFHLCKTSFASFCVVSKTCNTYLARGNIISKRHTSILNNASPELFTLKTLSSASILSSRSRTVTLKIIQNTPPPKKKNLVWPSEHYFTQFWNMWDSLMRFLSWKNAPHQLIRGAILGSPRHATNLKQVDKYASVLTWFPGAVYSPTRDSPLPCPFLGRKQTNNQSGHRDLSRTV